jgi:hypothetical protein
MTLLAISSGLSPFAVVSAMMVVDAGEQKSSRSSKYLQRLVGRKLVWRIGRRVFALMCKTGEPRAGRGARLGVVVRSDCEVR